MNAIVCAIFLLAAAEPDPHTLEYAKPKVALESIRFVFNMEGRHCVDLANPQFATEQQLPRVELNAIGHPNVLPLTEDEAQLVLPQIPESIGDSYAVYSFVTASSVNATIETFARKPTGDGGYYGIWAVLDIPNTEPLEPINWGRPVGIAVPTKKDWQVTKLPNPTEYLTPEAARERASITLNVEDDAIVSIQPIHIQYPNVLGYAVVAKDEQGDAYLHIFRAPSYEFVPIEFSDQDDPTRFLFEEAQPESCGAMYGSKLFILPDLDGNRCPEILIHSNVTFLYAIQSQRPKEFVLQRHQVAYMGP